MNPAIAALIKMLGIDPAQLEAMVNGSQQILADFDNRLKLVLAGMEELKEAQKRDTALILNLLQGMNNGRSSSDSSTGSLSYARNADITPGRSDGS